MKQEREQKIVNDYPEFFPNFRGSPQETCLAWGIAIGDGWANLFEKLCADIKAVDPDPQFAFTQVKEKFGGLRAYCRGGNEAIHKLIDDAETESFKICELCGKEGALISTGSWVQTLCDTCRIGK